MRVSIHITTRDRHSETGLLLQALRTQTFQDFDILLLDDASGTPLTSCQFVASLINRMLLEGHMVKIFRQEHSRGVCHARNRLLELDKTDNPLVCRLDDDCIPQPDYLERLHLVLADKDHQDVYGADLVSGVIPMLVHPEHKRPIETVSPIINRHKLDDQGNIVENKDDCGYCYTTATILPTHHFRTNAMFKRKLIEAGVRYPDYLTKIGFREEGFFSFEAIIRGFKLFVDTGAVAYHLQTPSGGCRSNTYQQDVQLDDLTFRMWVKEQFASKGNFLESKQ